MTLDILTYLQRERGYMMIYVQIAAGFIRLLAPLQYHVSYGAAVLLSFSAGGTWQCLLPRDPDSFDAETLPGWTPYIFGWPFDRGKWWKSRVIFLGMLQIPIIFQTNLPHKKMGDINLELDASWWWWPVSSCAPRTNHKPHTPPNWYRLISKAYPTYIYLYQVLSQVYPNHMTLTNCPHHLTLPQWSWRQEQLLSGSAENIERGGHIPCRVHSWVLINGDLLGFESSLIGTSWDLVGVLITQDESLLV